VAQAVGLEVDAGVGGEEEGLAEGGGGQEELQQVLQQPLVYSFTGGQAHAPRLMGGLLEEDGG